MAVIFEKLMLYWAYPPFFFVRYALVVGVLIALCSSLLGVTLVLKRFSFIGDGLSHVAFGAMSVAAVLDLADDMPLTLGITVISAVLLLRTGQNTKIKGDAAIAMISVGFFLISALVFFPALSAMRVYKSFRAVTLCSAVLSVCCTALGILISILVGTPVGSTIVAVDIAAFVCFSAVGRLKGGMAA